MKTKFKYIVLGSLLFGLSGFNSAKAITWPELRQALLVFQAEVLQSFAEVNETLDVHETRISDNDARIGVLEGGRSIKAVDANNLVIGELVSISYTELYVFTTQEYLEVNISMSPDVRSDSLYYVTTDCTGAPYSDFPNGTVYLALQPDGVNAKYYTPKTSVAQIITIQSAASNFSGPCLSIPGESPRWYFPASQNVPAITGVADIMYALPITFQRQ
jgi:hypothetical protein